MHCAYTVMANPSKLDRFLDVINKGDGVTETEYQLKCRKCSWILNLQERKNALAKCLKHFQSESHSTKSNWKILQETETAAGFRIQSCNQPKLTSFIGSSAGLAQIMSINNTVTVPTGPSEQLQPIEEIFHQECEVHIRRKPDIEHDKSKCELADIFNIPLSLRTEESYAALKKTPFLIQCVRNVICRGLVEPNYRQHDACVKDTTVKIGLKHGLGAAMEISDLTRGPSKSTILIGMKGSIPVLAWLDPDNLKRHLIMAKRKSLLDKISGCTSNNINSYHSCANKNKIVKSN